MERARVYFSIRIAKNLERMWVRRFFSSIPKNKKRLGYRNNRRRIVSEERPSCSMTHRGSFNYLRSINKAQNVLAATVAEII